MKKFLCLLLALVMMLALCACECDHDWEKATCEDPKTCSKCGETKGDPKDHDWEEEDGKIVCADCGEEKDEDEDEDEGDKPAGEETPAPAEPDPAQEILGAWTFDVTITEEMTGVEGFSLDGLPFRFTFLEDGTLTLTVDPDALDDAMASIKTQMFNFMEDMVYSELEAAGYSREDVDGLFEESYGMSVADYINAALEEEDFSSMLKELEETTTYQVEGDQLTFEGATMTFKIEGDTLTITTCDDESFWGEIGLSVPIKMKRVG